MTNITDLNDDCLYEILKYLPITDWCSLRQTCNRLLDVCDAYFQQQLKSFKLDGDNLTESLYNELTISEFELILQNFGRFLFKLTVNAKVFPNREDLKQVIPLLDQHCHELEDLKLVRIDVDPETIGRCSRLFSGLQRLVNDKTINDDSMFLDCLSFCGSLKELQLIRLSNVDGYCLARQFVGLESFSLKHCTNLNYEFLKEFFVRNPQLKRLKVLCCLFVTNVMFEHITVNLTNLETLSLRPTPFDNPMELLRLTNLRKLEMECSFNTNTNAFFTSLGAENRLESLLVSTYQVTSDSIAALGTLKTLKVLKFTWTNHLDSEKCKTLAIQLPCLSEIHIIECMHTTFKEINEFAEHSAALKKVVFIRYDDTSSLTKDSFLSLVEARQRNSNKEILNVILEYADYRDVTDEFMWQGNLQLFTQHTIIHLLPLEDEEDQLAMFEYGSGNREQYRGGYLDMEYEVDNDWDNNFDSSQSSYSANDSYGYDDFGDGFL